MPTGSCIYLSLFDVCVLLFVEAIFYIFVRQCFVFHYGNTREQTAETSAEVKISWDSFFSLGGNICDTGGGSHCRKHKFPGIVFHWRTYRLLV